MEVRRDDQPGRTLLSVTGSVDLASAPALRESLLDALGASVRQVRVDLAGVDVIDAAGLGALWTAATVARRLGRELVVDGVDARTADLMRVTGLGALLPTATRATSTPVPHRRSA